MLHLFDPQYHFKLDFEFLIVRALTGKTSSCFRSLFVCNEFIYWQVCHLHEWIHFDWNHNLSMYVHSLLESHDVIGWRLSNNVFHRNQLCNILSIDRDRFQNWRAFSKSFLSSIKTSPRTNRTPYRYLSNNYFLVRVLSLLQMTEVLYKFTSFRFSKLPVLAGSTILAVGCIILTSLRLKNWYIMRVNQIVNMNESQNNIYNIQGRNPIIFNVKGNVLKYFSKLD